MVPAVCLFVENMGGDGSWRGIGDDDAVHQDCFPAGKRTSTKQCHSQAEAACWQYEGQGEESIMFDSCQSPWHLSVLLYHLFDIQSVIHCINNPRGFWRPLVAVTSQLWGTGSCATRLSGAAPTFSTFWEWRYFESGVQNNATSGARRKFLVCTPLSFWGILVANDAGIE